jgi:hypothetical protein
MAELPSNNRVPQKNESHYDQELYSSISNTDAALSGILSGAIKIPEGFISLGAELIDLGFDTNLALKVERIFDEINPFEERASEKAIGKITEAITQVASVGTAGFKIATKLVDKGLKARKAGKYINLKNPKLKQAADKANSLNKAAKVKRFAAGVVGGAVGETFVADVEKIGTFGDMFENGPTQLETDELEDPSEDAFRKLMNRVKFGSESLLLTPFVYGTGMAIKSAATRGKKLAYSNSKLEKVFDRIFGALRARGYKPQQVFEAKMTENARKMMDVNRAMELVKRIDRSVDRMFPATRGFFDKSTRQQKEQFFKDLDDLMFTGNIAERELNPEVLSRISKVMKDKNLPKADRDQIIFSIQNARKEMTKLIDLVEEFPGAISSKDIQNFRSIMGNRYKDYLGNTYKIFENQSSIPFANYKPTDEAINKVASIFTRYAAKNNNPITRQEALFMVDEVLKDARTINPKTQLPFFKYTNLTQGATDDKTLKSFAQMVNKGTKKKPDMQTIGTGSRAFRELFGEIKDARYSIYNGMTKLSNLARKNQFLDDIMTKNDELLEAGKQGFFHTDRVKAMKALPNNEIVSLDKYLAPMFKDGILVNRLKGMFTTKDIAEGIANAQNVSNFFRGERLGATAAEKGITWAYRNLILYPKGLSQITKTVLSPVTHFRNFFSAGAFAGANGIFFTDPRVLKNAFSKAFGEIQVGLRPEKAMEEYRELLELGVVNSNVRIGDLKNLLKDVKFGEGISTDNVLKPMMSKLGKIGQKFQDFYVAEDDFWKITNYAVELDRLGKAYAKAGIKKSTKELKEEAADIVRNTVPNYAYVSDTVRALRVLPVGNFMSFPSEIMRTGTNIVRRALSEIKDPITGSINPITSTNPLKGIGMKRLLGMTATVGGVPAATVAGFQALHNVDDEELRAIKRFVPHWSKNSTILPVRDDETGELAYIDFSHGNAYDTLIRPIQTILNNVQEGIENEDVLLKGLVKGIGEAIGELSEPFISESIFTEAFMDIVGRGGVTREGKRLYTDETPLGDQIDIITKHLFKTMLPLSIPQFERLGTAITGEPSKKTGEFYEIPNEIAGFGGFRVVKLNPLKSMGFKITNYQAGLRNARREFTGGETGQLLKGGPRTANEVIRQFIIANRSSFDVQKEMYDDLNAAQTLGVNDRNLFLAFNKRGIGKRPTGMLFSGKFKSYFPSENIIRRFEEISREIGGPNPFKEALPTLRRIMKQLNRINLDGEFYVTPEDWIEEAPMFQLGGDQSNLQTPDVNPALMSQVLPSSNIMETGLTPTEQALLSEEEKGIRLRQRGMA